MASDDGATLEVNKHFTTGHSATNVCLWGWQCCVLDFIHLPATGEAEIAESTHLKGCPHTFGHAMYLHLSSLLENIEMSHVHIC